MASARRLLLLFLLLAWSLPGALAQGARTAGTFTIARLKYAGGGDWYNDPSAEANLLRFLETEVGLAVDPRPVTVEIGGEDFFSHPFLFLTGHGNIVLGEAEVRRLRTHLENGGFLYADDDYGLDGPLRRELRKVFPDREFVELPFSHGLYHCHFSFPGGPPKTHAHDQKPPRGFGIFHRNRLVIYYTYESNPSDGWADPEVHNDPEPKRQEALRFGANIVVWALTQ
ncbi:MAG: DUF4159 domain-containing protein [Bacteroidota bacterium]